MPIMHVVIQVVTDSRDLIHLQMILEAMKTQPNAYRGSNSWIPVMVPSGAEAHLLGLLLEQGPDL